MESVTHSWCLVDKQCSTKPQPVPCEAIARFIALLTPGKLAYYNSKREVLSFWHSQRVYIVMQSSDSAVGISGLCTVIVLLVLGIHNYLMSTRSFSVDNKVTGWNSDNR